QRVHAQRHFAAAVAPRPQHLGEQQRMGPDGVRIHGASARWLLRALAGTPNTVCEVSSGTSAWRALTAMIQMQPASEAMNTAMPSHRIGCRYHWPPAPACGDSVRGADIGMRQVVDVGRQHVDLRVAEA